MTRQFLGLLAVALPLPAGEIFGDVRVGDKYIADAPVQLVCAADTVRGKTDAEGSYRLTTKGSGKCTLTITHEKRASSVEVLVFDKPARYRLMLELKDGAYIVKRV